MDHKQRRSSILKVRAPEDFLDENSEQVVAGKERRVSFHNVKHVKKYDKEGGKFLHSSPLREKITDTMDSDGILTPRGQTFRETGSEEHCQTIHIFQQTTVEMEVINETRRTVCDMSMDDSKDATVCSVSSQKQVYRERSQLNTRRSQLNKHNETNREVCDMDVESSICEVGPSDTMALFDLSSNPRATKPNVADDTMDLFSTRVNPKMVKQNLADDTINLFNMSVIQRRTKPNGIDIVNDARTQDLNQTNAIAHDMSIDSETIVIPESNNTINLIDNSESQVMDIDSTVSEDKLNEIPQSSSITMTRSNAAHEDTIAIFNLTDNTQDMDISTVNEEKKVDESTRNPTIIAAPEEVIPETGESGDVSNTSSGLDMDISDVFDDDMVEDQHVQNVSAHVTQNGNEAIPVPNTKNGDLSETMALFDMTQFKPKEMDITECLEPQNVSNRESAEIEIERGQPMDISYRNPSLYVAKHETVLVDQQGDKTETILNKTVPEEVDAETRQSDDTLADVTKELEPWNFTLEVLNISEARSRSGRESMTSKLADATMEENRRSFIQSMCSEPRVLKEMKRRRSMQTSLNESSINRTNLSYVSVTSAKKDIFYLNTSIRSSPCSAESPNSSGINLPIFDRAVSNIVWLENQTSEMDALMRTKIDEFNEEIQKASKVLPKFKLDAIESGRLSKLTADERDVVQAARNYAEIEVLQMRLKYASEKKNLAETKLSEISKIIQHNEEMAEKVANIEEEKERLNEMEKMNSYPMDVKTLRSEILSLKMLKAEQTYEKIREAERIMEENRALMAEKRKRLAELTKLVEEKEKADQQKREERRIEVNAIMNS